MKTSRGIPSFSRQARRYVYAHRIVYLVHHGDIPDGMQINHKDGNKWNNHPKNLECVTHRENGLHSARVRGNTRGERHGFPKLTNRDIREIRRLCMENKLSRREIAERFGADRDNITKTSQRQTGKPVGP